MTERLSRIDWHHILARHDEQAGKPSLAWTDIEQCAHGHRQFAALTPAECRRLVQLAKDHAALIAEARLRKLWSPDPTSGE